MRRAESDEWGSAACRRAAAGLLLLGMAVVTHSPAVDVNAWHGLPHVDLGYHAAGYGLLTAIAVGIGLLRGSRFGPILGPALLLAAVAVLDEATQPWCGRTCAAGDLACDWAGISAAAAALGLWMSLRRRGTLPTPVVLTSRS